MEATTTAGIVPFWNRVSVVDSPVEETERSGIVVPLRYDGSDGVLRAVVVAYDPVALENPSAWQTALYPGRVVYYRSGRGVKIADVVILEIEDILAVESDPAAT